MAPSFVHLNGSLIPAGEAAVSVSDLGLLHGASVFTTMLARGGKVFRLDRHIARLMSTLAMLELQTDATVDSLRAGCAEVLQKNELSDARMRITLTPGSPHEDKPTTLVTADPLPDYPGEGYEKGIVVVVTSLKQQSGDPTYGAKTGCYLPRVLARREAAAKGAEEALWFTTDNRLAEACFCNVFLVADGKLRTPPKDTPVLPGVVREAIIELCGPMGLECDAEMPLTVHDMLAADEAFLTSSCSGIRPVARIERHVVGSGKPGAVTGKIMSAYQELLERECPRS